MIYLLMNNTLKTIVRKQQRWRHRPDLNRDAEAAIKQRKKHLEGLIENKI